MGFNFFGEIFNHILFILLLNSYTPYSLKDVLNRRKRHCKYQIVCDRTNNSIYEIPTVKNKHILKMEIALTIPVDINPSLYNNLISPQVCKNKTG